MKEGYVTKTTDIKNNDDLALINKFARKSLLEDDVYIFNVILCDNDIDRDNERFSIDALYKLKELFYGKTGIFDHDPKGFNQTARIFFTEILKLENEKTLLGENRYVLKAKAYMLKTEKNKDLISEIDGGIKKEVSIGCCVNEAICSICKKNLKHGKCEHVKGKVYVSDGTKQMCHVILNNPTDAYEWSFVAIPAQKQAGVIKGGSKYVYLYESAESIDIENMDVLRETLKTFDKHGAYLSKKSIETIYNYVCEFDGLKEQVDIFKQELKKSVEAFYIINQPSLDINIVKSIVDKMDLNELKEFKNATQRTNSQNVTLQTAKIKTQTNCPDELNFCI